MAVGWGWGLACGGYIRFREPCLGAGTQGLEPSLTEVPQVGFLGVAGIWVLWSKWQMVGQGSGPHLSPIHQSDPSSAAQCWRLTTQSVFPEM